MYRWFKRFSRRIYNYIMVPWNVYNTVALLRHAEWWSEMSSISFGCTGMWPKYSENFHIVKNCSYTHKYHVVIHEIPNLKSKKICIGLSRSRLKRSLSRPKHNRNYYSDTLRMTFNNFVVVDSLAETENFVLEMFLKISGPCIINNMRWHSLFFWRGHMWLNRMKHMYLSGDPRKFLSSFKPDQTTVEAPWDPLVSYLHFGEHLAHGLM